MAAQIAGALVLLVGAVLFAESFMRAQAEDPGYAADNLMIVRIELPRTAYRDGASWARFFNEASARLKTLPGVAGVGGTMDFFMRRNGDQNVTIEGRIADPNAPRQRLTIEGVTPGFFDVAGIELVEGRMFDERDLAPGAAPVFIVNELMARQLWPGESAVGKRMVNGRQPRKDGRWDTVVGVVRNCTPRGPRPATVPHRLQSDQFAQLRSGDSRHDRRGGTDSRGAPRVAGRRRVHSVRRRSRPFAAASRSASRAAVSSHRPSRSSPRSRSCSRLPASTRCWRIR